MEASEAFEVLSFVLQGSSVQKHNLVAFFGEAVPGSWHLLRQQHRNGFVLVCCAPTCKLQASVLHESDEESGGVFLSCAVAFGTALLRQGGGVGAGSGELSGKH